MPESNCHPDGLTGIPLSGHSLYYVDGANAGH